MPLVSPALRRVITPPAFVNLESLALITALAVVVNLNPVALLKLQEKVARQMTKVEERVALSERVVALSERLVAQLERLVAATLLMATLL